jgi:hypothetical protein
MAMRTPAMERATRETAEFASVAAAEHAAQVAAGRDAMASEEDRAAAAARNTIASDVILNSIADDPDVRQATGQYDFATPSTHRQLISARLAALARAGIAPQDCVPF